MFLTTTLAFVALGFALYFLTFLWCKEVVVRIEPRVGIKDTFKTLKTNKPLGILCASSFFYLIGVFAVGGATAFYAIYVLGDAKFIIWMTLVTVIVQFACAPFVPFWYPIRQEEPLPVLRAVHRRRRCRTVLRPRQPVVAGAALHRRQGLRCVVHQHPDVRSGGRHRRIRRMEDPAAHGGATYAIFSFTRKITQSIGGALGAFALALGGYITKLAADQVQPESAITAIKASIGLVPAAAAILAMIVFIAYPLTEKLYSDIVAENDTRKQKFLEQQNIATVPIPPVI